MKILVDMNLSPEWVGFFATHGIDAAHWSEIGNPCARDSEIMEWAREHGHIVFPHDLDFAAILATTKADGPSVLQMRTQDVLPSAAGEDILRVLKDHQEVLEHGAIVTMDKVTSRIRILPILKIVPRHQAGKFLCRADARKLPAPANMAFDNFPVKWHATQHLTRLAVAEACVPQIGQTTMSSVLDQQIHRS
jgi:predicted nuclease of predicted toxin-antitoxin system